MFVQTAAAADAKPDTTQNRHATAEDASYWPTVNEGDYIFFTGNTWEGKRIYSVPNNRGISLPVGGKIFIYAGDYQRIHIDGSDCESTPEQPTIVTNLGGQVRIGNNENNDIYRGLGLVNFEHLHLTAKWDPEQQTGHPDYLGHDGGRAMGSGDYYEKYGIWIYPRWSGPRFHGSYGNGVTIAGSDTVKIDYISSWGGSFAAFNIKTNHPEEPGRVSYDIQDCFAGFANGEGFYVGFSATKGQDFIQLILRNNIVAFAGSEGLQTSNLTEGTVIENNVVLASATFYRHPFMAGVQDHLHQVGFVEGGVTIRNNMCVGANRGLHPLFFSEGEEGRAFPDPDKKLLIENNYYGFGRWNIGFIRQGDGITPYDIINNVYGPIMVPGDPASAPYRFTGFFTINNDANEILFQDNIYPEGMDLYQATRGGGQNILSINNLQEVAPLPEFRDSGFPTDFDYRLLSFYASHYENVTKEGLDGQPIPYEKGEVVLLYDADGETLFYECIQAHDTPHNPLESPEHWKHLTWNGRNIPPLDLRLKEGSYYEERGMGLAFGEDETP